MRCIATKCGNAQTLETADVSVPIVDKKAVNLRISVVESREIVPEHLPVFRAYIGGPWSH